MTEEDIWLHLSRISRNPEILIKKHEQDRDIVTDKGFKMLGDGPLDHGALRRICILCSENKWSDHQNWQWKRDRHWRIMDYAGRNKQMIVRPKVLFTQQSYVCFLEMLGNGFPFGALSQELMTRVTRQWHRNVSSKRWWHKNQLLSDYPHIVSFGPAESQHKDLLRILQTAPCYAHLTHHQNSQVWSQDDKCQQRLGDLVTSPRMWPGRVNTMYM